MSLKVLELFGGIGACTAALKRLGIGIEVVDYVEIDKHAVASYNAINGTHFEPQDIKNWDKDIKVDFVMHGSPCQDFSLAGIQKGGDKGSGTRSSLMYETVRIVEKLRPKYVLWENVANLLSEKHFHNFANYINALGELGYCSAYRVLNAKDFGIPQNRERVFTISVLGGRSVDLFGHELEFQWPKPFPLEKRLKDLLEDEVDKRFFLTNKQAASFLADREKMHKHSPQLIAKNDAIFPTITTQIGEFGYWNPYIKMNEQHTNEKTIDVLGNYSPSGHGATRIVGTEGIAPTVMENHGQVTAIPIKNATEQGYLLAEEGDGIDLSAGLKNHRGTVQKGMTQTLTTAGETERGVVINDEIRKLTPRECWRLMGRTNGDFEKAEKVCSNSQLYKQAGNSIVVDVLFYLLKNVFEQYPVEE